MICKIFIGSNFPILACGHLITTTNFHCIDFLSFRHFYWRRWLGLKLWEFYVDVSDAMRVGSQKGIFEVRKFLYSQRVSNFSLSLTSFLWWVDFFWIFTNFTPNHNYSSLICLIRQNKIWYSVSHNSIAPPDFSGNHGNHKNWVKKRIWKKC